VVDVHREGGPPPPSTPLFFLFVSLGGEFLYSCSSTCPYCASKVPVRRPRCFLFQHVLCLCSRLYSALPPCGEGFLSAFSSSFDSEEKPVTSSFFSFSSLTHRFLIFFSGFLWLFFLPPLLDYPGELAPAVMLVGAQVRLS